VVELVPRAAGLAAQVDLGHRVVPAPQAADLVPLGEAMAPLGVPVPPGAEPAVRVVGWAPQEVLAPLGEDLALQAGVPVPLAGQAVLVPEAVGQVLQAVGLVLRAGLAVPVGQEAVPAARVVTEG